MRITFIFFLFTLPALAQNTPAAVVPLDQVARKVAAIEDKLNGFLMITDPRFAGGCKADNGVTDNHDCLEAALRTAAETGSALTCPNGNGAKPSWYSFRSPISVKISRAFTFKGSGIEGCVLRYDGPATAADAINIGLVPEAYFVQPMIEGMTFLAGANNPRCMLGLNNLADFSLNSLQFSYAGPARPNIQAAICLRGTQQGSITNTYITAGYQIGIDAEQGIFPAKGNTTSLTAPARPDDARFAVASCGTMAPVMPALNAVRIDNEVIRGSCTAGTFTVASVCGTTGTSLCRGDEATTPASHAARASVYYAFPIASDNVNIQSDQIFSTVTAVHNSGGGFIQTKDSHLDAAGYGITNVSGITLVGQGTHFEDNSICDIISTNNSGLSVHEANFTSSTTGCAIEAISGVADISNVIPLDGTVTFGRAIRRGQFIHNALYGKLVVNSPNVLVDDNFYVNGSQSAPSGVWDTQQVIRPDNQTTEPGLIVSASANAMPGGGGIRLLGTGPAGSPIPIEFGARGAAPAIVGDTNNQDINICDHLVVTGAGPAARVSCNQNLISFGTGGNGTVYSNNFQSRIASGSYAINYNSQANARYDSSHPGYVIGGGDQFSIRKYDASGQSALIGFDSHGYIEPPKTDFANLAVPDGKQPSIVFCTDCAVHTPCTGSGSGAWAFFNGTSFACPF